MSVTALASWLLAATLVHSTRGAIYALNHEWVGHDFYDGFTAQAIPDPTHGRVNYVDSETAQALNLTYATHDTFILRTDFTTVLNSTGPGRNSVRIQSNEMYNTSVLIADIRHMPQGCGTWPALWTLGEDWPYYGEIDILEGVNDVGPDTSTFHTGPNCTMPIPRPETGTAVNANCDSLNGGSGCDSLSSDSLSYGLPFNANGGGWFAMERTEEQISVWFWHRHTPLWALPPGIALSALTGSEGPLIDTLLFGEPFAHFPSTKTGCNIGDHLGPHWIIINLTLCGDWAGQDSVFSGAGCPGACVDYVNNNPNAFVDAYFDFASLAIYTPIGHKTG